MWDDHPLYTGSLDHGTYSSWCSAILGRDEAHDETLAGTQLSLSNGAAVFENVKIIFDKLSDSQKSSSFLFQKMADNCYPSPAAARGPI